MFLRYENQKNLLSVIFDGYHNGVVVDITLKPKTNNIIGSYQLSVSKTKITISAGDKQGAFYGVQTLASLLTLADLSVPLVEVDDAPRYQYRGQHLDVARNFHNKKMVLTLIEQMAAYKLNKLHLHLAEDEGWRLQLPSFPELTDIGGKPSNELLRCNLPEIILAPTVGTR